MLTREEKARQLLHAMTEIDDRYIAEAAPENAERSEDSEGVLYMKAQKRWKPMGIIAAAAVLVIGFGAYMKTEHASDAMAPVAFVTGADSGIAAAEGDQEMAAEAAPYSDDLSGNVDSRARTKSAITETGAAPEAASSDAQERMQIANPWSEFDSLEEAEADALLQIKLPESYQNFDHRIYRSMHGEMLEIIYQNADGQEGFRIRKSHDVGDISGDYTSYAQEKTLTSGGRSVTIRGNGDTISVATWSNHSLNLSYAICVAEDQHFTEDDIRSLVEAIDPDL